MIQSTTAPTVPTRLPLGSIAVVAVIVVLAIAAGQVVSWAANPAPTGAFAKCHTAVRTGPHTFAGPPAMCIDTSKTYDATITTTKGDIGVVFLAKSTPQTVNNFIVLAVNGYFTGQPIFQKTDWYIESGDPTGTGRGGPGYLLPDEQTPDDAWAPGSLGMARFAGQGVSGSQFFITTGDFSGGPPTDVYNHFATVTIGFDLLSQITTSDRILSVSVRQA